MAKNQVFIAAQGELFNEAEVAVDDDTSEVDAEPEMETVTYTRKARGKRQPLPKIYRVNVMSLICQTTKSLRVL